MLIVRYIYKEIISAFSLIVGILMFIAISNKFVTYLAKAAAGKMQLTVLLKVVSLYIPELFCTLAPVTMFMAILITFSRLYADSEAAVLFSSGYDWAKMVKQVLIIAGSMAIIIAVLNFSLVPIANRFREELISKSQISGVLHAITPGRFQTIDDNEQLVFYVEDIQQDGTISNIFIAAQPSAKDLENGDSTVVLTAKHAQIEKQDNDNEFYLVLKNGYRYVGTPGHADYTVTKFAEYGRELKYSAMPYSYDDGRTTLELLSAGRPQELAEVQWRFAMPFATIILALFAIPLAVVAPRQGRFAKFLPAIVCYMVYYNCLTVVKRYVGNGKLPAFPGLWSVHLLFLAVVCLMLFVSSGRFAQMRYKLDKV